MIGKTLKNILKVSLTFIAVIAVIFLILFMWFGFAERPIPMKAQIISKINDRISPAQISTEDIKLKFVSDINFINIKIVQPKIFKNTKQVIELPDVILKTNPFDLIMGSRANLNVYINDYAFKNQRASGSNSTKIADLNNLFELINQNRKALSQLSLNFNKISFTPEVILNINDVHLYEADQYFAEIRCNIEAENMFKSKLNVRLTPGDNDIIIALTSDDLDINYRSAEHKIKAKNLQFDAQTSLRSNLDLDTAAITLKGGALINFDDKKYSIKSLDSSGDINIKNRNLTFNKLDMLVNDIEVKSKFKFADSNLKFEFGTSKVNYDKAIKLLPNSFISATQDWLAEHIKNGALSAEGNVAYNLASSEYSYNIALPVEDVKLDYYNDLPPVTKASGLVTITPGLVNINVEKAAVGEFDNVNATGEVEFNLPEPSLQISASYYSEDLQKLLRGIEGFIGTSIPKIDATATAQNIINIKMPLSEKLKSIADIDIKVESDLKLDDFAELKKFKLSDLNLDVLYHNGKLSFEGNTIYDKNLPLVLNYSQDIGKNFVFNYSDIAVKFNDDIRKLKYFFDVPDFISGKTLVNIKILPDSSLSITSDLVGLKIDAPQLLLHKSADNQGRLSLELTAKDGQTKISDLQFEVSPVLIKADLLVKDKGVFGKIIYNNAEIGSINIDYSGQSLNFDSPKLDLSDHNIFSLIGGGGKNESNLNGKLDSVILKNGIQLKAVNLIKSGCPDCKFSLNSAFAKGDGSLDITSYNNKLLVTSNDAASVVKGLGIFNDIEGGSLSLQLDTGNNGDMTGSLKGNNFYVLNNNLFLKIFALPTLTVSPNAVKDVIEGGRMKFESLECPLQINDDAIILKNCIANGNLVSIKIEGVINLKSKTIELEGLFIPQNVVNNLVSGIPILGEVLSGGKDAGIIATSFKLVGSLDDPQIIINPLSTITPGITREIMKIFN